MSVDRGIAIVTGASRGIGKAVALTLARAGYGVALTARSLHEGEAREHSSSLKESDTRALPGSLRTTEALIREIGGQALSVPADLLDPASLGAAVTTVLERWGRIDVLVHNGRYIGPGLMDRFLDTPIDLIQLQLKANVIAPLILNKLVIPSMIANGGGTIVNITSAAAYADPTQVVGEGGWGLGYGISKGGFHRIAGFLALELEEYGIRSFNVQPGLIATERLERDQGKNSIESNGAPPEVVGEVVRWLCTSRDAGRLNGTNVEAQFFCHERGLLPNWSGPRLKVGNKRFDKSGARLASLEEALSSGG